MRNTDELIVEIEKINSNVAEVIKPVKDNLSLKYESVQSLLIDVKEKYIALNEDELFCSINLANQYQQTDLAKEVEAGLNELSSLDDMMNISGQKEADVISYFDEYLKIQDNVLKTTAQIKKIAAKKIRAEKGSKYELNPYA